jgi:ribonuclease HII
MPIDKYNHKKGYPNHSRTMSLDLKECQKNIHRSWALKKIKEAALKKRDPLFR